MEFKQWSSIKRTLATRTCIHHKLFAGVRRLYIILKGQVSIYVIQDHKDTPRDVLAQVEAVCSKPDFEREQLGQFVWSAGVC